MVFYLLIYLLMSRHLIMTLAATIDLIRLEERAFTMHAAGKRARVAVLVRRTKLLCAGRSCHVMNTRAFTLVERPASGVCTGRSTVKTRKLWYSPSTSTMRKYLVTTSFVMNTRAFRACASFRTMVLEGKISAVFFLRKKPQINVLGPSFVRKDHAATVWHGPGQVAG